jgi:hypothetical protein
MAPLIFVFIFSPFGHANMSDAVTRQNNVVAPYALARQDMPR